MEEEIKTEVEEVTRDTLLRLTPKERVVVLIKYHKWLKDVRKSEKKELFKEKSRINRFKNKQKENKNDEQ